MLRALTHGRNANDESEIGPTQAMYSTILVILQASSALERHKRQRVFNKDGQFRVTAGGLEGHKTLNEVN